MMEKTIGQGAEKFTFSLLFMVLLGAVSFTSPRQLFGGTVPSPTQTASVTTPNPTPTPSPDPTTPTLTVTITPTGTITTPTVTLTVTPISTTTTPTITPTVTPTVTPTPVVTPLPTAMAFDFSADEQGWVFQSPAGFVASTGERHTSGTLDITISSNSNVFAFWESPEFELGDGEITGNEASPNRLAPKGSTSTESLLYRTDFVVKSNLAERFDAPAIRLRSSTADFSQSTALVISSIGAADLSPVSTSRHYTQYFSQPAGQNAFRLDFEVLAFDVSNAENATLSLESADIRYLEPEDIGTPLGQSTVNLAAGETGFAFVVDPVIPGPALSGSDDGLWMVGSASARREVSTPNLFGSWAGKFPAQEFDNALFRLTWTVESDATAAQKSAVPAFRLRVNDSSFKYAAYLNIDSNADSQRVPVAGTPQTYDLWFSLPPEIIQNDLILSFDYIHADGSDDDSSIRLTLRGVEFLRYSLSGTSARRFEFRR